MFTHTKARAIWLGFIVFLLAALLAPQVGLAQASANVEHAEIGRLEALDLHGNRVVTALPVEEGNTTVYRSYDSNFDTNVFGLGDVMEVEGIPQAAMDNVVVVTFVPGEDRPLATSLYFPDEQEVAESHGTVEEVPGEGGVLVVSTDGVEEEFDLAVGPGARIDSNEGLLAPSDLVVGQEVTVYHGDEGLDVEEAMVVFVHG